MANKVKTFADFLTNHSHSPKLHRKAWAMGGVSWKEFKERPNDYYAANTGSVKGCIYYADTVKFAKKNLDLIHEEVREYEKENGEQLERMPRYSEDETTYYNWLTWFAWENMASALIGYLES